MEFYCFVLDFILEEIKRHKRFISTDFSSENKDNQHVNRHRHISADSSYSTATSSEYDSDETPKKAKLTKKRPQSSHLRAQSAKESFNRSEKNLKHQDDWNHKPSNLSLLNTQSLLKSKDDVRAQNVDDSTVIKLESIKIS